MRAEIINLLIRIQDELQLSYVFISHDLSMVRHISDDIAVMYLGEVVEVGDYEQVLDRPLHPYTVALADAIPVPNPELERSRKRFSPGVGGAARRRGYHGMPVRTAMPLSNTNLQRGRARGFSSRRPDTWCPATSLKTKSCS